MARWRPAGSGEIALGRELRRRAAAALSSAFSAMPTVSTWVYSPNEPIRRVKRGYIPPTDQSDARSVGIFPQRTNQTREAWVYSHNGPIRRGKRGYIPTTDQSDAGSVGNIT
eukprot:8071266-Pyramimonas_sp.AAC.1